MNNSNSSTNSIQVSLTITRASQEMKRTIMTLKTNNLIVVKEIISHLTHKNSKNQSVSMSGSILFKAG